MLTPAASDIEILLAELRERGCEFRDKRQVPLDVVEKLKQLGVYRALVPQQWGGDEITPTAFIEMVERIAEADGSTGWTASLGIAPVYLGALPRATLEQVYATSPDLTFAGRFASHSATRVPGGIRVSGRWPYGSGCLTASLLGVGISIPGEEGPGRRVAVLPKEKARIEENWNAIGLAGTGSHDIVIEDVLVPEDWTFFWGAEPSLDVPILRYPSLPFTAQVFAAVGLGCARRAIQELTHLAVLAVAGGSRLALKDRAYVQSGLARAEASLSAERAFLHQVTDEVWNGVLGRHAVSAELDNRMRLASTHLAQISAEVARTCWEMAGSAALHPDHILSRCMQDCSVVAQHFYLSEESLEMAGRVMLGRHQPPTVQPPLQN